MQKLLKKFLLIILIYSTIFPNIFAQEELNRERRGQSGMKFLSASIDARAASMADAMTAQNVSAVAMFYNPASMANFQGTFNVALGQTQWVADIDYNVISMAYNTSIGVFGLSGLQVNYGEFLETIRADNERGYVNLGEYQPSAFAVGIGYARQITSLFSIGGDVKYAKQNIGEGTMNLDDNGNPVRKKWDLGVMAFDLGFLYETGFESLNFGVNIRNFAREVTYAEEKFELPLTFRIGASMDMFDLTPFNEQNHSLLLAVDTEKPRDYSNQMKVGIEYIYNEMFALRGGYIYPTDEQGVSFGLGVKNLYGFAADYAISQFGVFGTVNRFIIQYTF